MSARQFAGGCDNQANLGRVRITDDLTEVVVQFCCWEI
ncbi:hypothetical protein HMPREF1162_0762 [ [[Propionibacterium] namnetense SK182B-JCVI]|uniref:Uncharacterized protein n=1 Tax=[Propionibacterium] namnetense SK182B-JCVI TaxID=1051006 RepID=F9NVD5_9ACTN|nr:hypothetical protein HMPREF1162_0762 [ [[Propionibacterium] namnetense SK182B-JCVI]